MEQESSNLYNSQNRFDGVYTVSPTPRKAPPSEFKESQHETLFDFLVVLPVVLKTLTHLY